MPSAWCHLVSTSAVLYSAAGNLVPISIDKYQLVVTSLVVFWWYDSSPRCWLAGRRLRRSFRLSDTPHRHMATAPTMAQTRRGWCNHWLAISGLVGYRILVAGTIARWRRWPLNSERGRPRWPWPGCWPRATTSHRELSSGRGTPFFTKLRTGGGTGQARPGRPMPIPISNTRI
jgi:hypothetical protein